MYNYEILCSRLLFLFFPICFKIQVREKLKNPGSPGLYDKNTLKISRQMDFQCPGKLLHQLRLRETDGTQILRRIGNRFCHQMANNKLLSLF